MTPVRPPDGVRSIAASDVRLADTRPARDKAAMWTATILTLAPEAWPGALGVSVLASARSAGLWALETCDWRTFGTGKHRQVDDTPAGGGAGMVLKPDVAAAALDSLPADDRPRLYLTPRGAPISQTRVRALAQGPGLVAVCGRFEGLDQRVIEARGLVEVCVGDVVLAGGDVAAQLVVEACVRLLPGVLGNAASPQTESFEDGLLEHPLYTRPRVWEGAEIPDVLLSGDHARIEAWKRAQALAVTQARRPDLFAAHAQKKR
jgi:tRNA (guanine37-N1)-methyltransferase